MTSFFNDGVLLIFMKKHTFILLMYTMLILPNLYSQDPRERTYYYEILEPRHEPKPLVQGFAQKRVVEKMNRGLTATLSLDGQSVYLSWRLLDTDPADIQFNIYRKIAGKTQKLNTKPIAATCDFVDSGKYDGNAEYFVKAIVKGKEIATSESISCSRGRLTNYHSIKLQEGVRVGKMAIADLNGDGKYDFIVRTPDMGVDPGTSPDTTGITYKISAYLHDGTYLWPHDMGLGIEPGVWYSPFIAFDFNGDGKAEVAIKGASDDYVRNERYRISGGSEFLLILDGMTGEVIDRVDWPERNFRYGDVNRQNRHQIGMAYLDGKTPCLLAARGTYKLMVVDAWQLNGKKLEKIWRWDGDEENPVVRSQGAHSMVSGDVDGDGRDEILLGSCMLNDNGTLLWSSGLGHSDKAYLTKVNPAYEGMQVFMVAEPWKDDGRGVSLVDAKTGKLIWGINQYTYHVGDGMVADFDSSTPGLECFASEDSKGGSTDKYLLTSEGRKLDVATDDVPPCRNWVWWDSDLLRETIVTADGGERRRRTQQVVKWKSDTLTTNIEGSIQMIADFCGDWREEIITTLPGEIRIYTTNIPAKDRRVTLMQDPIYRSYVLHRSMGYPQSPVPGYYLGE